MLGDSATTDARLARPPGLAESEGRASKKLPYNARNTDDPKDIEYRVEARIDEHSEDVQLKTTRNRR